MVRKIRILVGFSVLMLSLASCAKRRTAADYSRLHGGEEEEYTGEEEETQFIANTGVDSNGVYEPGIVEVKNFIPSKLPTVFLFAHKSTPAKTIQPYLDAMQKLADSSYYAGRINFAVLVADTYESVQNSPTYSGLKLKVIADRVKFFSNIAGKSKEGYRYTAATGFNIQSYPSIGILSLSPEGTEIFSTLFRPKAEDIEKNIAVPMLDKKLNLKSKTNNIAFHSNYMKEDIPVIAFVGAVTCSLCKPYYQPLMQLAQKYKNKVKIVVDPGSSYDGVRESYFSNFNINIVIGIVFDTCQSASPGFCVLNRSKMNRPNDKAEVLFDGKAKIAEIESKVIKPFITN